jgi:hypothetical protein
MSQTTEPQPVALRQPDRDALDAGGADHPHRRRRRIVVVVSLVAAAAVLVVVLAKPFSGSNGPVGGGADNADPTSTTTVRLEDISSQSTVSATLGYSGSYSVVNQAQGTLTGLPAPGQVVSQGQVLYDVDGSPVLLLYGTTPAYRSLSEGATDSTVNGPDVAELNDDLVALGYLTSAEVSSDPSDFTYWTKIGVEDLQAALGVTQNGTLALGQVVFMPTAVRVTGYGGNTVIGGMAQPGSQVLTATSTGRIVTIALDADQQNEVATGDKVTISLPNGETTPGTVTSVGTVATTPSGSGNSGSSPTITVLVTPDDPAATGTFDQAPVQVSITTATVKNAFVVPIDALLALAGGGYGLEVVSTKGGHSYEPVSLGLFDDAAGVVQISGPGVAAGQRIVVPGA